MKTFLLAMAATAALALPAAAGTFTGEVRLGDVRNRVTDSTEYRLNYAASPTTVYNNAVELGGELIVRQLAQHGAVSSKLTGRVGPVLASYRGFAPSVYVEFGESMTNKHTDAIWGAGAAVAHQVHDKFTVAGREFGPVSASLGYRHREGFSTERVKEDRVNLGVKVAVAAHDSVGVNAYRTTGTINSEVVGFSYSHQF